MKKEIEITCALCGKKVNKPLSEIKRQQKRGRTNFFCCLSCAAKWHNKNKVKPIVKKVCPVCGKEFTTSTAVKKDKTFCSRGCASKGSVTEYRRNKARLVGIALAKKYPLDIHALKRFMESREGHKYANLKEYFESKLVPYEFEFILENKLFDLALPSINTLVEFDGAEHRCHSGECYENDIIKNQLAEKHNWKLVRIPVQSNKVIPVECIKSLLDIE